MFQLLQWSEILDRLGTIVVSAHAVPANFTAQEAALRPPEPEEELGPRGGGRRGELGRGSGSLSLGASPAP